MYPHTFSAGKSAPVPMSTRFCRILLMVAAVLPVFLYTARPARAMDTSVMPAEKLMRMLPTSIFENTTEPVSQDSLELLLARGYSTSWIVVENTRDRLRMVATGDSSGEVQMQVLRTAPNGIIILGARTSDSCATELWSYNARGWLMPYSGPQEPSPQEFFVAGKHLPRGLVYSCRLCLERGMLEAVPWFRNASGAGMTPDNRIFYIWNGEDFVKRVLAVTETGDLPSPSPAGQPPAGAAAQSPAGGSLPGDGKAGQ